MSFSAPPESGSPTSAAFAVVGVGIGVPNARAPGLRRRCAIWDGNECRFCGRLGLRSARAQLLILERSATKLKIRNFDVWLHKRVPFDLLFQAAYEQSAGPRSLVRGRSRTADSLNDVRLELE